MPGLSCAVNKPMLLPFQMPKVCIPLLGTPHLLIALGKSDRVTTADLCIKLNRC